jgi:hypothetical protein
LLREIVELSLKEIGVDERPFRLLHGFADGHDRSGNVDECYAHGRGDLGGKFTYPNIVLVIVYLLKRSRGSF